MAGAGNILGKGALLLTNVWGERRPISFLKRKEYLVIKGSVLVSIPDKDINPRNDGKPAHNYCVFRSNDITLYCSAEDVAPLTKYEFQLLNGIKSPEACYKAFIDGLLDWGTQLKPNSVVYVTLPSKQPTSTAGCQAEVRWIGKLPSEYGILFGLEITEEQYHGAGYTDGSFREQQYFLCDENCGMFESLDKLAPTANYYETHLPQTFVSVKKTPNSGSGSSGLASATHSQTHKRGASIDLPLPRFHKGDRVAVYNTDQTAVYGTVRWTGQANTETGKVNAVGIEMVLCLYLYHQNVPVSSEDFLLAFTGMGQYFKCEDPRHGKVILPEELVLTHTELELLEAKKKATLNRQDASTESGESITF